jgi:hypothetical protein
MLDRRALAPIEALGLTEARVRGAIRALERVGFIERMPASGRTHQRTPDGLHRKPVTFTVGADYRDAFSRANKRAAAARDGRSRVGRAQMPAMPQRPSTATPAARPTNSEARKDASPDHALAVVINWINPPTAQTGRRWLSKRLLPFSKRSSSASL